MTVSQALKKLAIEGFIERHEHQEDTRAKSIALTKKGKKLALKLVPLVEGIDVKFFNIISIEKQKSLTHILNNLIQATNE